MVLNGGMNGVKKCSKVIKYFQKVLKKVFKKKVIKKSDEM